MKKRIDIKKRIKPEDLHAQIQSEKREQLADVGL